MADTSGTTEEERQQQRKEMMRLREEEDLTLEELAEEFDVSRQTVHNRIKDHPRYEKSKKKVYRKSGKERQHATKEQVVEDVKKIAEEKGRLPTKKELDEELDYSVHILSGRFGNAIEAYEAAGILNKEYIRVTVPEYADLSRDDFREALQEMNERTEGERMKYSEYNDNRDDNMPSVQSVDKWYGSWAEALIDAGLKPISVPVASSGEFTEEDLIEALKEVADKLETTSFTAGDYDTFSDICHKKYPGVMTIINYFGNWNKAKSAADLDRNTYRPGEG